MKSFVTDKDREIFIFVVRDNDIDRVLSDVKKRLNGIPGMEVLEINNECSVLGNKIIHTCWVYYRPASGGTDDTKRI